MCMPTSIPRAIAVAFWASPVGVMGAFPLPGDNNAWRLMAPVADPDRSDPAPRDILAELEAGLAPLRRHHSLGRVGVVVSDAGATTGTWPGAGATPPARVMAGDRVWPTACCAPSSGG